MRTSRRSVLTSTPAIGALLAGCQFPVNRTSTSESDRNEPRTEIVYDPYEGVSWDTVERHKATLHNHTRDWREPPKFEDAHEVIDFYAGDGTDTEDNSLPSGEEYTIFAYGQKAFNNNGWPWSELTDHGWAEDRNPETLGVVSVPAAEHSGDPDHIVGAFSSALNNDIDHDNVDDREDLARQILDQSQNQEPNAFAAIAHPNLHYDDLPEAWDRYVSDYDDLYDAGLHTIEAFNRFDGTTSDGKRVDVEVWDQLLSHFAPERPIFAVGNDDNLDSVLGSDMDILWTTVLLDPSEFDPSDQTGSRAAAAQAFHAGRTIPTRREQWDPSSESMPVPPTITQIDVDEEAGTITVSATDHDSIEWYSIDGDVVATGDTLNYGTNGDAHTFARAHVSGSGGEISTQPFGLTAE